MLAAMGPRMLRLAGSRTAGTILWLSGPTAIRGEYKAYWTGPSTTTTYTSLRAGGRRVVDDRALRIFDVDHSRLEYHQQRSLFVA